MPPASRAFFTDVLDHALQRRGAVARRVGGRIGVLIDGDQWVIDLDHAFVTGPLLAVEETDRLDVVVELSGEGLASALKGGPLSPRLVRGDAGVLTTLAQVLSEKG